MNRFHFHEPLYLLLFIPAIAWTVWLAWKSDSSLVAWRRWTSLALRLLVLALLIFGLAGGQWRKPKDGMNVTFALDRSDSIPSSQQESAREVANQWAQKKRKDDRASFLVFGTDAAIESQSQTAAELDKVQAVVASERTDIAGAIRLAAAAFSEHGQKKVVLLTDGNQNIGDAFGAVMAAKPLGVTVDVLPLGVTRDGDVSVQKLGLPANIKKGQTFEAKIFATSDRNGPARVKLYQNDKLIGQETAQLSRGKNLFSVPLTLNDPGFYGYQVVVEADSDRISQNNKASSFINVRGDPRVLIVSSDPTQEQTLLRALKDGKLDVKMTDVRGLPATLAEMQVYDAIFLCNIGAGELGRDMMQLLESAVRDFGVGLVCLGGDNAFAAGGYRNTPLEATLPVDMELSSKKVLPSGALVMVMHGMEFNNGNQVAREIGLAALDALGPQDELGVVLWNGSNQWLFELQKVADKSKLARLVAGMNQGDLPDFQGLMSMARDGLAKSSANLKHIIVFSDGDPGAPSDELMGELLKMKVTVSTVMIGGHVQPTTMQKMAEQGRGRFYDVKSAAMLPQIFIKEAAVILKSAIFEEPFQPQVVAPSELIRGIPAASIPILRGYVATTQKPRAETPILSQKGDPVLAHWQYGLGRSVAWTSDAKAKWAQDWLTWGQYQQFWSQTANWALRRLETSEFNTEVSVDKGQGIITVEALDRDGNFRNFLNLQTAVVSPRGERVTIALEQTGPGHYEAKFPTKEVGSYLLNLMEMKDGTVTGSQVLGASVNYSPEFDALEPDNHLLNRLAEVGGGRVLSETDNPFEIGRQKTFQPFELWEALLKAMICLFVLDVGVRRVDFDREEWGKWMRRFKLRLGFGDSKKGAETQESLGSLLAKKEQVRTSRTAAGSESRPDASRDDLFKPKTPVSSRPMSAPTSEATTDAATDSAGSRDAKSDASQPPGKTSTTSRLLDAKRRAKR